MCRYSLWIVDWFGCKRRERAGEGGQTVDKIKGFLNQLLGLIGAFLAAKLGERSNSAR